MYFDVWQMLRDTEFSIYMLRKSTGEAHWAILSLDDPSNTDGQITLSRSALFEGSYKEGGVKISKNYIENM